MLFHSTLRKDLSRSFGATVVVLSTIVMTNVLIRTLGQASVGGVNPSEIMLVMGFSVLGHLTTILTLSLFISVVSTLSRMYADSEMVIWFSSGQGLASFTPTLFRFAWPILLAVTLLALVVWPWSNRQAQELSDRYEQRNDIERVAPGQFQESAGGKRVFFIDKDTPDNKTGTNVFISSTEGHVESITSARQGRIELRNNERVLKLSTGQQILHNTATGNVRVVDFNHYEVVIDSDVKANSIDAPSMISTWDLVQNPLPRHLGELAWRLGLGLAALNLLLLALAVATANPRVGRSYHTALALLIFMVYYNMINVGQSWIGTGRVSFSGFLLALHGSVCVLGVLWIMARHFNLSWRYVFKRRVRSPRITA